MEARGLKVTIENQEPSYILLVAALREAIGSVGLHLLKVQLGQYRSEMSSRGFLTRAILDAGNPHYDPGDVHSAVRSFMDRALTVRQVRGRPVENLIGVWANLQERLDGDRQAGEEHSGKVVP